MRNFSRDATKEYSGGGPASELGLGFRLERWSGESRGSEIKRQREEEELLWKKKKKVRKRASRERDVTAREEEKGKEVDLRPPVGKCFPAI